MPKSVVISLRQHIGAPCEAIVKKGDVVEEGQLIGEASAFVSSPVHASISGKVKDVLLYPHPGGGKALSIVITGDGTTRDWEAGYREVDIDDLTREEVRGIIRQAGIVGMGGAAFPTAVKLSPPGEKKVDTVILNGCECEPYLTTDHRTMVEHPDKVIWGLHAIMKTVGATEGFVGIESNKPDAIAALESSIAKIAPGIRVVALETKYPQGAEKMLIHAVSGRTVPTGKLPLEVGVVVNNTGTAIAVYDALHYGKPLIERVVTISGNGVKKPGNLMVRVGTSFGELIEQCGGMTGEGERAVLNGGPMMGISQSTLEVPVLKGTSGITVLVDDELKPAEYRACIKCSRCIDVCPMGLMPFRLGDMGRVGETGGFKSWAGLTCIECGCCSFVCPSKRPLVQWIRVGKVKLREAEREEARAKAEAEAEAE